MTYVFGYASLVALREGGAVPARLRGFRRRWGAAMDNWDAVSDPKHWVEPESRRRPRVRVAYLDIEEVSAGGQVGGAGDDGNAGSSVNGLAVPVDAARLALIDAREVNYERIDVTAAFEPMAAVDSGPALVPRSNRPGGMPNGPGGRADVLTPDTRIYAYRASDAARARCRAGAAEGNVWVSAEYLQRVRDGFAALAEFDRTTEPLPFPVHDLEVVLSTVVD